MRNSFAPTDRRRYRRRVGTLIYIMCRDDDNMTGPAVRRVSQVFCYGYGLPPALRQLADDIWAEPIEFFTPPHDATRRTHETDRRTAISLGLPTPWSCVAREPSSIRQRSLAHNQFTVGDGSCGGIISRDRRASIIYFIVYYIMLEINCTSSRHRRTKSSLCPLLCSVCVCKKSKHDDVKTKSHSYNNNNNIIVLIRSSSISFMIIADLDAYGIYL